MNETEKNISSLKSKLQKIDKDIRSLLTARNKKEEKFKEEGSKYNNLQLLINREIKEKEFQFNKYSKAIEIKKNPSESQEKEIKRHTDLEEMLCEKIHKNKILLRESEKESEEVLNLKAVLTNLESENASLKKSIKDTIKSNDKLKNKLMSDEIIEDIGGVSINTTERIKGGYKNLINEAIKVGSGYYEGDEINQAIKFYINVLEGDKAIKTQDINKASVDDITIKLKKYVNEYDLKMADLLEHESGLLLQSQQLKTNEQKNKSEIDSANAELRGNSGEFVGGSDFFVSFCDVQSVLLCFFVVFFAISNQDYEKFEVFFSTWNNKEVELNRPNNISLNEQELKVIGKVKELVKSGVDPETLTRNDADKVRLIFPSSKLFAPGEIKISRKGLNRLNSKFKDMISLGGIKQIRIESYTDKKELMNSQKLSKKYYNNLTLSIARSNTIARVFNEQYRFSENSTIITGYDSTRQSDSRLAAENKTMANRVEIEIIRDKNIKKKYT
ncbi:MAG: OmpA family protein [Nitrospinae bacterium]|nr:OmpA family protein [Nitrospinota bacterium]